jgi:hypothetical protein
MRHVIQAKNADAAILNASASHIAHLSLRPPIKWITQLPAQFSTFQLRGMFTAKWI